MLKNYFKIAARNLAQHKMFSLINLAGLSIATGASLMLLLYVSFELSYDKYHRHADDIYRIRLSAAPSGGPAFQRAKNYGFVGPALEQAYPEILAAARLINLHGIMGNFVMSYGDTKFVEENFYYADASLFDIFSYPVVDGDPKTAFKKPNTAVITQSTALRYFGTESPLGKSLVLNGTDAYLVTAVIEDVPGNSHLKFDFLLSLETLRSEEYMLGWADFFTYVLLAPGTNPEQLNEKLLASDLLQTEVGSLELLLSLQPLTKIHLYSNLEGEAEINGDALTTYGLLAIAFFILIIAWINYVNLSTARSIRRAKEVGLRKVIGAQRKNLIGQFMLESFCLNLTALLFGILLIFELLPWFSQVIGKSLAFDILGRFGLWSLYLMFVLGGTLISSLYPAFILSSFRPIRALRGQLSSQPGRARLMKSLVIYQFVASVILITGTWVVFRQLSFMKNQDLGIDITQTVIVQAPAINDSTYGDRLQAFKTELLRLPPIHNITTSSNIPGRESTWGGTVNLYGTPRQNAVGVDYLGVDYSFLDTYKLKLLAGRNFSEEFSSDRRAALVNEAAMQLLSFPFPDSILGQVVTAWRNSEYEIIGVVGNHHQLSLKYAQTPILFMLRPGGGSFYSIKLQTAQLPATLSLIEQEYARHFPGNPFEYTFLDEYFGRQYRAEQRFGQVFGLFSGLAIFIACLGLLALSADAADKRTKEIGIRKTLGATIPNLIGLLTKDLLTLVLIANAIAIPIAALTIRRWLQSYAYQVDIGWAVFALPAVTVVSIAVVTVGVQAFKTALKNPVETLRYE